MSPVVLLGTVGLAIACLIGYILVDGLGQAVTHGAKDALWRRPSLAQRRHRSGGLLRGGVGAALLAAVAGFLWAAAATSGDPEHAADARVFGLATAALTLVAAGLLAVWWRRSGTPRHY